MANPSTNFRTPGQLIKHLLDERSWSQQALAVVLNVDQTGLNKVVTGKRPITAELALRLGEIFGVDPGQFLELQKSYELEVARITTRPDPGMKDRAALYGDLPIAEMIKRGWISAFDVRDKDNLERELIRFFSARSLQDIEVLPHAAKRTKVSVEATPVQLAWLYRVKQIASQMVVESYSQFSGRSAIKKLGTMLRSADDIAAVPRVLTDHGIRYVVVEALASSKIDGVCFWLDSNSPVIAMSTRLDRIDNFWFVLRHECEHMIHAHGLYPQQRGIHMLDIDLESERAGTTNVTREERTANDAAAEFCVPQEELKDFMKRKGRFVSEKDLIGFANTHHIHPGLVVGQLQHKTGRYDLFRSHLVKVRSVITSTARVDGWGLVAQTAA